MKLNEIISKGEQISPVLLDLLYDPISIPKDNPYNTIAALLLIMETITKLSWVEHSSDWDIGCVITLNNGSVIETEQGWGDSLKLYDTEGNEIYPESNTTPYKGLPRYYDPSKTKGFIY